MRRFLACDMLMSKFALSVCYALGLALSFSVHAQNSPHSLNVSGGLFTSTGAAVVQAGVNFKIEILDKNATCVLYSEQHMSEDLTNSKGAFSLLVGEGTSISNKLEGTAAFTAKIFENNGATGAFTGCASGVTNASGDERLIRIYYDLGAGFIAMTPDVPLVASAYALVAETLQGKNASDFAQINTGSAALSQANLENIFSNVNYPKLNALVNGSSTQYMVSSPSSAVGFNGQRITSVGTPTAATDAANKSYADSNVGGKTVDVTGVGAGVGGGKTLVWDQALNKWVAQTPSAALSQIVAGTGLVSNTITTTGTLAVDVGTTANKIVQLNAQGKLPALDAFLLTNIAFPVTSVAGRTGAVTLNPADISGLGTAATQNYGTAANNLVQLNGSAQLPAVDGSLLTNINATKLQSRSIAATAPAAGQVLTWNATTSVWEPRNAAVSGITDLTGDVSASGSGSVAATIANSAITSAKINASGYAINRLLITDSVNPNLVTYANCANGDVLRYGPTGWLCNSAVGGLSLLVSGTGLVAGSITTAGTLNVDVGTTAGKVLQVTAGGQYPALDGNLVSNINAVKIQARNIASTAPAGGQVLGWNSSSSQWEPTSTSGVGTVTGIYTGTGLVGNTITASGTLSVDVGSTANKIVQLTAAAQYPGADGALIANISATRLQSRAVAGIAPAANQVLTWNNSTSQWEPQAAQPAATDFVQNGNAFGTTANLGTTDVTNLNILTNNSPKVTITSGGNVGIGTTVPVLLLEGSSNNSLSLGARSMGMSLYSNDIAGPNLGGRKARGTAAAPLAVQSGDYLGSFGVQGYDGSAWQNPGFIGFVVNGAVAASSVPADFVIQTGNVGTGAERVRVTASGNVGIGTSNPARRLEVSGTDGMRLDPTALPGSPAAGDIVIDSGAANTLKYYNGSGWVSSGSGTVTSVVSGTGLVANTVSLNGTLNVDVGSTANKIVQLTAGGQYPAVDGALISNVNATRLQSRSLAATAPAANQVLTWNNTTSQWEPQSAQNSANAFVQNGNAFGTTAVLGTTDFTNLNLITNNSTKLTITSAGNVGLGTTSPGNWALTVQGIGNNQVLNLKASTGTDMVKFNTLVGYPYEDLYYNGGSSIGIHLDTNGSSYLNGGNVGIGTTTPAAFLDVNGTGTFSGMLVPRDTTALRPAAINGTLRYNTNTSKFEAYEVGAWTNIIGTAANAFVQNGNAFGTTATLGTTDFTNLNFISNNSTRMTISSNGNVGIGTTVPSNPLDVQTTVAVTAGTYNSANNYIKLNGGSASSATIRGGFSQADSGNSAVSPSLNLYGAEGDAYNVFTGTLGSATGVKGYVNNTNTGTISSAFGVNGAVNAGNGTIGIANGGNFSVSQTSGTVLNGYAVYLGNVQATNKWSLYASDASAPSYFAGNVGIGTPSPAVSTSAGRQYLTIAGSTTDGHLEFITQAADGDLNSMGGIQFTDKNSIGSEKRVAYIGAVLNGSTANNRGGYLRFFTKPDGGAALSERLRIDNAGNIGIGTTLPARRLEISGTDGMRLDPTALPGSPSAGDIVVDSGASNTLKYYNGTGWVSSGSGTVTSVISGAGLVGNTISLTGTLNVDVGTLANKIVQLTASAQYPAVDGYLISNVNAAKLQGRTLASTAPSANQVLTWNNTTSQWEPQAIQASANAFVQNGNAFGTTASLGTTDVTNLNFLTCNSAQMTITSRGNVGIGTTNPTDKLHVLTNMNSWSGMTLVNRSNGTAAQAGIGVVNSGFVGINLMTTSTGYTPSGIFIPNSAYLYADSSIAQLALATIGSNPIIFAPAASEAMRVSSNGNVGIGTTSPSAALDVNGTGTFSSIILPRDTTANRSATPINGMLRYNTSTSKFEAYEAGSWSNLIGTASNAFVQNGNAFGTTAKLGTTDFTNLNFMTNNSTRLTITSLGNIGVGTATPSGLFDVATKFVVDGSGNLTSSGQIVNSTTSKPDWNFPGGPNSFGYFDNSDGALHTLTYLSPNSVTTGSGVYFVESNVVGTVAAGAADFSGVGAVGLTATVDSTAAIAPKTLTSILAFPTNSGSGTAQRSYGLYVANATGNITNKYAIVTAPNSGSVGIGTITPSAVLDVNATGTTSAIIIPRDTTANRSATPINGMIRYNTNTSKFEAYEAGAWSNVIGTAGNAFVQNGNAFGTTATLGTTDFTNLNLITNNSTRMTISSNGNIGIGTLNPGSNLHVVGQEIISGTNSSLTLANGENFLHVKNTSTTVGALHGIAFSTNNAASLSAGINAVNLGGSWGADLQFATKDVTGSMLERMRISGSGNVGIGTSSPGAALDVNGTGTFSSLIVPRDTTANRSATPVNGMIRYNTNTAKFEAYESGVWTNVIGSASNAFVQNGNAFGATAKLGTTDITNLNFLTCNNIQMTITSRGAVGIGTSTPIAALDVTGSGTLSGLIVPRDTTANRPAPVNGTIRYNTSTAKFEGYQAGSWTNLAGGSASFPLLASPTGTTAAPAYSFTGSSTTGVYSPATDELGMSAGNTEIFHANSTGVRIGSGSPNNPFEVTLGGGSLSFDSFGWLNLNSISGTRLDLSGDPTFAGADLGGVLISGTGNMNVGALINGKTTQGWQTGKNGTALVFSTTPNNTTTWVQRMMIDHNGNVAIGANTPIAALDITGTGTFSSILIPRDTTANRNANPVNGMLRYNTNTSKFEFYESGAWVNHSTSANGFVNGGNAFGSTATLGTTDVTNLNFLTCNNVQMTITSRGAVGVGTTTPTTLLEVRSPGGTSGTTVLQVGSGDTWNSSIQLQNTSTNGHNWSMIATGQNNSLAVGALQLFDNTAGSVRMQIGSTGNVGIGTSSANVALDVNGTGTFSGLVVPRATTALRPAAVNGTIRYNTNTSKFEAYEGGAWTNIIGGSGSGFVNGGNAFGGTATLGTTDAQSLNVITSNISRFYVDSGGSIGVGTVVPVADLQIGTPALGIGEWGGASTGTTQISMTGTPTGAFGASSISLNSNTNLTTGQALGVVYFSLGNINSNVSRAQISALATENWSGSAGGTKLDFSTTDNGGINPLSRFTIGSNGAIGIGNASPSVILDVNGTGTFSGLLVPRATTAFRPAAVNGTIRYNTNTSKFEAYESGAWTNMIGGGASGFVNGGNAFGSNASLGTTDVTNLNILTCNNVQMTLTSRGDLGLGFTVPSEKLDVNGNVRATQFKIGTAGAFINDPGNSGNLTLNPGGGGVINTGWGSALQVISGSGAAVVSLNGTGNSYITGGNFGVGTTTPNVALDVTGTGTFSGLIVPRATTAFRPAAVNGTIRYNTNTSKFEAYESGAWTNMIGAGASGFVNGGNAFGATANLGTTDVTNLNFLTCNNVQMTITSKGLVGIGTQAPTALVTALTSGTAPNITTSDMQATFGSFGSTITSTAVGFFGKTRSSIIMGGTNSVANNDIANFKFVYGVRSQTDENVGGIANITAYNTDTTANSGGYLTYSTRIPGGANAERMRIDPWGNVGLGTTSPGGILDLNGTGTFSSLIVPRDTTANRPSTPVNGMIRYNTNTAKLEAYENGGWGTISANRASSFVNGGNAFGSAASLGTTDVTNLNLLTCNNVQLTITSLGNIGVGTTTPAARLDVNGKILASGAVGSREVAYSVAAGATYPASGGIDMGLANVFRVYTGTPGTCPTVKIGLTNMTSGLTYTLAFIGYNTGTCTIQDESGATTNIKFYGGSAPTLASAQDVICSLVKVNATAYISCLNF